MLSPTRHGPATVRFVRRLILGLLAVMVVFVGVLQFSISILHWQSPTAKAVFRVIRLPAASLGWQSLVYADYLTQLDGLRHYNRTIAKETTGIFDAQSETEMRQATLRKLVRDQATLDLLKSFNQAITKQDIDRAFSAQILQSGNQQATTTAIAELYQWTPEIYKQHVVTAAVAREKLREYLTFHRPYNQAGEKQARSVLALVQQGDETFEELAKKYSDDEYAMTGGDLGVIRRGEQDEVIEQAAFELEQGTISELLHTKYGWHILKSEGQQEIDGQEQVRIRQIFIAGPSVDQAITEELKQHRIMIWIQGFRWDAAKTDVVTR